MFGSFGVERRALGKRKEERNKEEAWFHTLNEKIIFLHNSKTFKMRELEKCIGGFIILYQYLKNL